MTTFVEKSRERHRAGVFVHYRCRVCARHLVLTADMVYRLKFERCVCQPPPREPRVLR